MSKNADYRVGRGKPPVEHRFQKGKSGNPKGRPKASRSVRSIIDEAMNEQVSVRISGKLQKMTKKELIIRSGLDEALKGNLRAKALFLKMIESLAPESVDPPPPIMIQSIPGDYDL